MRGFNKRIAALEAGVPGLGSRTAEYSLITPGPVPEFVERELHITDGNEWVSGGDPGFDWIFEAGQLTLLPGVYMTQLFARKLTEADGFVLFGKRTESGITSFPNSWGGMIELGAKSTGTMWTGFVSFVTFIKEPTPIKFVAQGVDPDAPFAFDWVDLTLYKMR